MITELVAAWEARKDEVRAIFASNRPSSYRAIVEAVVSILSNEDDYDGLDKDRIHQIDDGHYQGTLLFVIAAKGYQPSDYWYVKVYYGSCSGCDTLESIDTYSNEDGTVTESELDQYMTLALHIVQGLKKMGDD